ncbi:MULTISPECIES: DUF11 domain-containing protein [unclassified Pseudoxanthomonas]|uniref:prealbumin-like fold domain-containing protein n=1 Tax=unclassified Pseudoxanthomonas TaxID=2645906 RepID=UPI0008F1EB53|nr:MULTISPECIES: DUF11 domain-containing protein [unclassified Pseudoxanthomonas]SFV26419.1 conserved repeat domain-containing protein [Pseudoxanthomonas sp. YR558]
MKSSRAILVSLLAILAAGIAGQANAQFKVNAPFRNSTESGWTFTGNDNAGNNDSGILTGGYGLIVDGNNTNDAVGNGWLRLSTDLPNQVGSARYTGGSFPSSQGVIVEFDYVAWSGTGADGISFYLYDANETMAGAIPGAGLGYCNGAGGYLGIGLDEFGNFSGQLPGVTGGCSALSGSPGSTADRVVVRGPLSVNNVYVGGAAAPGGIDVPLTAVRPAADRARILLIPNGLGGYRVTVALGQGGGALTTVLNALNFPYAAPANLRMGFGGSTGGLNNIHEVRGVVTSTPANITVAKTTPSVTYLRGLEMSYSVTITNRDINPVDAGIQAPTINGANAADILDTLPAQIANASWTCTASAGSTCPAASGTGNLAFAGGYTLAPGGTLTFVINGTVSPTAACGATVTNTASADFSATDGFADLDPSDNMASASFTVQCPSVVVQKVSVGDVGTFGFTGTNGIQALSITTAAAGTATAGATQALMAAGVATTITEDPPAGAFEVTAIDCTGMAAGGTATPDMVNRSVVLDAQATRTAGPIVCTFTNGLRRADLQVVKTASKDPVMAGEVVDFSLTVTNNGPRDAMNVLLSDAPGAGLDCFAPSTTATCSASGGASCPSPTIAVSTLLGGGITLPALPVGGQAVVTVRCMVTATGTP